MKPKSNKKPQPSPLEIIHKASIYKSARSFLGLPLLLIGSLAFVGGLLSFVMALASIKEGGAVLLFPSLVPLFGGLLLFGISALGSAIFDMADVAVRADARALQQEAKDAYQAFRAAQENQKSGIS